MKERKKEAVAITKYEGTSDSLKEAIALCGGFEGLKPHHKILLKPNIVWAAAKKFPPYGIVTTSAMVDHLLYLLREHGCSDITIGEGTLANKEMGSNTMKGYVWSGIGKVAKKYGVRLVDFNTEPFEEVELDGVTVKISKWASASDFLINLPVLKAHRETKISLGMKNLKGYLALNSKKKCHLHGLPRLIALLNTKINPSLTVIDGIYGLEKGPDFLGTPHRMNLIIAGRDTFSCDLVGTMVMGMKPEEVDTLREFASLEGRSLSPDGIEVRGERIDQVARKFEWSLSVEDFFHEARIHGITVQDPGESCCSGCATILTAFIAVFSKDSPGVTLDGVEICMGGGVKAKEGSKKVFLLGNCAIANHKDLRNGIRVKGCPPPVLNTVVTLTRKNLPPKKFAKIMASRLIKNIGMKLGIYETFPALGIYGPPEFDRSHF